MGRFFTMQDGGARAYGRSAARLTIAVGAAGALVYVFFALASHTLDREDYGRIVVLWSAMFLAVSVLFRPVELLLAKTIAENRHTGRDDSSTIRVAFQIQGALCVAFIVVALIFKEPLEDELFAGESLYFWSLLASVVGFGASYTLRGYLAGSGRFGLYSALLLIDAISRVLFALLVAVAIAQGPTLIALGIAIPPGLSAVATVAALSRSRAQELPARADVAHTPEFTFVEGSGFAASVFVVMVAEQVFLNSGPILALVVDGSVAAGFVFNILMLVRAPVILFQATATSLLPHLSTLVASVDPRSEVEFRLALRHTLTGIAAFTAVTVLTVLAAGPELMQLAFSDKFEYDRLGLLIVAAGMGLYLAASTLNQAALARGHQRGAAACWGAAALCLGLWYAFVDLEVDRLVEVGFACSAAVLCVLLTILSRASSER